MKIKTAFTGQSLARSIAMGVLISMVFFYGIHVLGTWQLENYRPNDQTTYTMLLHNTCAIFGDTHTLRPNTGITVISDGINGTKLSGSFMNFTDGHIIAMAILALLLGAVVLAIRIKISKSGQLKA
jgi:hypothetical protein